MIWGVLFPQPLGRDACPQGTCTDAISDSDEAFDAVALAAFTVSASWSCWTRRPGLWLWGPIAAVLTGSFGGLMRDLLRHARVVANLRGELGIVIGPSKLGTGKLCSRNVDQVAAE
jgi:uncharacterized membrane protein YeiH